MIDLKIFIFKKLADFIFKITESSYYKNKVSFAHLQKLKSVGVNCSLHPQTFIINPQYITLGSNVGASRNFRIEAINCYKGQIFSPEITIGNNVVFNTDIHIGCIDKVLIGDNCLFASRILITDHDHGDSTFPSVVVPPRQRPLQSKGPVIIGENCWIGEGAAILSGVTIGKNSIIATNSVVTGDIPEFCIAAGIPAKIIKRINI